MKRKGPVTEKSNQGGFGMFVTDQKLSDHADIDWEKKIFFLKGDERGKDHRVSTPVNVKSLSSEISSIV